MCWWQSKRLSYMYQLPFLKHFTVYRRCWGKVSNMKLSRLTENISDVRRKPSICTSVPQTVNSSPQFFFFFCYLFENFIYFGHIPSLSSSYYKHSSFFTHSTLCPLHFKIAFLKVIHSQFLLPIYSWMCSLPLEDIWLIRDYTLKDSLSLSSYYLLVAPKIGVALDAHLSLPCWRLFWLELVPSCRSYHSLYEPICPAAPMFLAHTVFLYPSTSSAS